MQASSPELSARNNRIIVIDDNPAIHADVRKILCPQVSDTAASLDALEAELLGGAPAPAHRIASFTVDDAHQGREGFEMVKKAVAAGLPYAMAFVDVRMPPGWDGVETTLELWKVAPDLQIVICTAYSDYSWDDLLAKLGRSDRLVILKKPFDTIEVLQLANALTEKWNLIHESHAHAAQLENRVQARTAELQESNSALQREIVRRMTMEHDLNRAKNAAETADRAKSAFLANMSHEIRTPMNGVIGMANLLLSSPLSADQRDLAETLCQSSDALLTIINDILDFSKIEAGRLVLESIDFNLSEHLELALDLHADAASKKSLELVMQIDPDVPGCVRGDPIRLRQIVLNLLSNAIKFTSKGEVVLRVKVAAHCAGRIRLRFEVVDTGIGIASDVQAGLFQPFVQADASTTRRFGGSGLGLAISRRLTELMHGEIGLESSRGRGSTFWFTAELEQPQEPMAELAIQPSQLQNYLTLIVDDNATNRKLLVHLCSSWRLPHRAVDGALAALEELRAAASTGHAYDVVILDHHMPDIDGLGLARMAMADPTIPKPAFVMLTSRGERLAKPQLQVHGLSACELKPIHPEKLRTTLTRVMAARLGTVGSAGTTPPIGVTPEVQRSSAGVVPILIAEDNAVNQKVTLLQLRNLGYAAHVVKNGREAIDAVRRHPYALVLMDAQMPELDGIAATRQIRAAQLAGESGFPPELRIIAMTANAMAGDREMCLEAGMDDYLAKPVRPDALRAILDRYLSPEATIGEEAEACALSK
jgi:two-component system, sensor histidine kinase and response regulator